MTRPNILVLMVDQLAGPLFPDGPADFLHAPNLKRLAARSLRFSSTYTASPLCAPARASFMSGQLPSKTRVYDNAAEFSSEIPTFAHHLRRAGYGTTLCGKMHFVGPDQLHGFEERLTTDIYPADFGWTPDWSRPNERIDWWYHNLGSVTGAGTAETTNQLDYDDEVAHLSRAKLYDLARRPADAPPFCLTVSFTHPHDPYVARPRHFALYEDSPALAPSVPRIAREDQDPHSRRLMDACEDAAYAITDEMIATARRAYFASVSYIDEKIGELLDILQTAGLAENTAILFVSDHGDMLGERGLWFKMNFFEHSAGVPMMLALPGGEGRKIETPVSTLDVLPTLCAIAGVDLSAGAARLDGTSLLSVAETGERDAVPMEYAAEGSVAPMVALRDGDLKYVQCPADPEQLFDVASDPDERRDLAGDPAMAGTLAAFRGKVSDRWDLSAFEREVRESQQRRLVTYEALRNGAYYPWDFQPLQRASERYMRNHMDLNVLESDRRLSR